MILYDYQVSARGEDDQVFEVSKGQVKALDSKDARQKAREEGWDDRLDCTGCRPRVRVKRRR